VADFFLMGGYAAYVWSAFGITALVLYGNVLAVRWRRRAVLRLLQARQREGAEERESKVAIVREMS
jgi:heme exporter protein D